MKNNLQPKRSTSRGFTVLLAVLISAIVLAVGMSILSVVFKQLKLSGIVRQSEVAFQAAYAGAECVYYWDRSSLNGDKFDIGTPAASISCFGVAKNTPANPISGGEQKLSFTWGPTSDQMCSIVSVYKYYEDPGADADTTGPSMSAVLGTPKNCPEGGECTIIKARGYNAACTGLTNDETVEREVTIIY